MTREGIGWCLLFVPSSTEMIFSKFEESVENFVTFLKCLATTGFCFVL